MGFGYNGSLEKSGERLDMLDFFSWMKQTQREWSIWDASAYYIVNKTSPKKIQKLGDNPSAKNILDVLVNEQERPKRAEIIRNCDLRSLYLKRLIELSNISAEYFDSRKVFREDPIYANSLDISLEFVNRLEKENPELVKSILPKNATVANSLYLPLEIAEAVYLQRIRNVSGKFGPKTEELFDDCILKLEEEIIKPYSAVWCPSGPKRQAYLNDSNVLRTTSSDGFISSILKSNDMYKFYVQKYLSVFQQENESLFECARRMRNGLKEGF